MKRVGVKKQGVLEAHERGEGSSMRKESMPEKSRPETVAEVVGTFHRRLNRFREHNDYRAIFLHAYLIITRRFLAALEKSSSGGERVFLDAEWTEELLVAFANLYLDTLQEEEASYYHSSTWAIAHRCAKSQKGTVVEDLLLGVNAHINVDLAFAVYLVLNNERVGTSDPVLLARRKFDYEQVNRILFECIDPIEEEISRYYGGVIGVLDVVMGSLDEALTRYGVRRFREQVWWHGLSLLCAETPEERALVRERIEAEAQQVAENITSIRSWPFSWLHRIQRSLRRSTMGALSENPDGEPAVRSA